MTPHTLLIYHYIHTPHQHEDMGPLEIRASTLSRELEEVWAEIKEQQQFWLWQQGEIGRAHV